jgi:glycosyltransferase involved in cell wall biosynthesis
MGGAEIFTHEVAKRWVQGGHEVALFTSEFSGCKREEVLDGIRVVRRGGRLAVYWWAKRAYKQRFSKEGYDVVIDEINTRPFFMPNIVNDAQTVALIHQLAREYWFYETFFPINYVGYRYLENRWLKDYVDVPTVTVSESTKRDLLDLGFKKVFVVPEGVNFKPLGAVPEKQAFPVFVYVGRLTRAKRPDHAVRAFQIVREKMPESELWMIGDGPFRRDLERMAGYQVKFLGSLSNEDRRKQVSKSWVLINSSVREGWGLNIIEANALGVPCVAYDVAGLRNSVKEGVTGLLAAEADIENLAEKIAMVSQDDALRATLSRNALEYSKGFNWDETAKMFMNVLSIREGKSFTN